MTAAYARRQTAVRTIPKVTEEPLVTIHLLNEIRTYCNGCGQVASCGTAKSAAALSSCKKIQDAEPELRKKAGCPA